MLYKKYLKKNPSVLEKIHKQVTIIDRISFVLQNKELMKF